jgi:hypothetical protein
MTGPRPATDPRSPGAPTTRAGADRRLAQVARTLRQDLTTAEVATRLLEAGIPVIVLKGPTFARWLYDDGEHRTYVDSDLLVPRRQFREATSVLRKLGFRPTQTMLAWQHSHARSWWRPTDGAALDLHHMLGLMDREVDPWPVLVHHTEPVDLAGSRLAGLDEPARCLHVALHAAQSAPAPKPLEDLHRALTRAAEGSWQEAAVLAKRLACTDELVTGLRLHARGAALADGLGVGSGTSGHALFRQLTGPARTYGRLTSQRTMRGRISLVVASLLPDPLLVRRRHPWARGPLLAPAHVVEVATGASRLLRGGRKWRAAWTGDGRAPFAGIDVLSHDA